MSTSETKPKYASWTEKQLLQKIANGFEKASSLGYYNSICWYSHKINGVGCAIGCLLTKKDAEHWDSCYESLRTVDDKDYYKYFIDKQYHFLEDIQRTHDNSTSLRDFRDELEIRLEEFNS